MKLAEYGYTFQVKLMAGLLTDIRFVARMYDILKIEYFEESQPLTWICNYVFNYYMEYKELPTDEVFKIAISNIKIELQRDEIIHTLDTVQEHIGSTDLEFIKETAHTFCKNQEFTFALLECHELLPKGEFEKMKERMDSAMRKGEDNTMSYDYIGSVEKRYKQESRKAIPTGWDCINEIIRGGLGPGELGVIVAPGGAGKSWVLQHISLSALKVGKNVVFVTLELMEDYVAIRHDILLTNIPNMYISDNIPKLCEKFEELPGTLSLKWYPEDSLSMVGLRSFMDKFIMMGGKPDMLVVDYADLMKLSGNDRDRHDQRLKTLYQQLRGLGGELKIPVWTASQSNRDSYEEEVIGANKISESIGKHHTADLMISLMRKDSDKASNTAKFHIVKNRLGRDGMTFVATMDTNKGIIELFPPKSKQHVQISTKMLESEEKEDEQRATKLQHIYNLQK